MSEEDGRGCTPGWPLRLWIQLLLGLCVLFPGTGCGKSIGRVVPPTDGLPGSGAVPGWATSGKTETFSPDTLFDLMDGQAEAFFVYGFEQAATSTYAGPGNRSLRVEVYRLATPADAYGLFTVSIGGEPAAIGVDGDTNPGRYLAFWQDRFYVRIMALQPIADADLLAFGRTIASALPSDGERPALVASLPAEGLVSRSARFFHQELSIQDWLWLGGTNLLNLGPKTNGVLASYERGGGTIQLLLVLYPEAGQATAALDALRASDVSDLVAADVDNRTLGAVFGTVNAKIANGLLKDALR